LSFDLPCPAKILKNRLRFGNIGFQNLRVEIARVFSKTLVEGGRSKLAAIGEVDVRDGAFVSFSFSLAGYGRVGLHRQALGHVRAVVVQALHLARRRRLHERQPHERQRRRAVLPVRKREPWRYR